ncbi:hypothetical protein [Mesorhizobium sp. M1027]|uniref:hypothetical protein n=1 Tax=Mesorhizobium sp. M1027 TaxID=2957050 RepID=UPI003335B4D4
MCDEYPQVKSSFRGPVTYDATLEAGMLICIESHFGAVGERDGVKLEKQLLVTSNGYKLLTYPFEERLLGIPLPKYYIDRNIARICHPET